MQELRADAVVETDAARDLLHVGAGALGEIGDLVDERHLRREERIGRVLDQFGGAAAGVHDRRLVQIERPVDFGDHLLRTLVVGADHDPVRMLEVADRRALAQELRIGGDDDIGRRIGLAHDPLDIVAGADRHRRFGDDDGEAFQRGCDLARRRMHIGEVRMAVAAARGRADRDEHRIGFADRTFQLGGERQPPGLHIGFDQPVQIRLENRDFAALQRRDLASSLSTQTT